MKLLKILVLANLKVWKGAGEGRSVAQAPPYKCPGRTNEREFDTDVHPALSRLRETQSICDSLQSNRINSHIKQDDAGKQYYHVLCYLMFKHH